MKLCDLLFNVNKTINSFFSQDTTMNRAIG